MALSTRLDSRLLRTQNKYCFLFRSRTYGIAVSYPQFSLPGLRYHIISYHIISYHIISYHIISYHTISYHTISYSRISYHIISCHIISYHTISYHILSYHTISYHIISYHTISYHIISYHIIPYHTRASDSVPSLTKTGSRRLFQVQRSQTIPFRVNIENVKQHEINTVTAR